MQCESPPQVAHLVAAAQATAAASLQRAQLQSDRSACQTSANDGPLEYAYNCSVSNSFQNLFDDCDTGDDASKTPVKSAGHAGDGRASAYNISTPVKSLRHAGDGYTSLRTYSTPVKSAGHVGDGFALNANPGDNDGLIIKGRTTCCAQVSQVAKTTI
eukprot:12167901-Karenia_brevis.AAC.1